ncbi:hypothetical protein HMPREF3034_00194, partial [Prevotella sp. DNF00663]
RGGINFDTPSYIFYQIVKDTYQNQDEKTNRPYLPIKKRIDKS